MTAEDVRSILDYDPATGVFLWKVKAGTRRYKGSPAGNISTRGYRIITIQKRAYKAHRLAWLLVHGVWPDGPIDHINGDTEDNRIANLRVCSTTGNGQNQTHLSASNTSGYRGVSRLGRKWRATVQGDGVSHYLGMFSTPEEAASACEAARSKLQPYFNPDRPITEEEKLRVIRRATDVMTTTLLTWKRTQLQMDAAAYRRAVDTWERIIVKWATLPDGA